VLEHIPEPRPFLLELQRAIGHEQTGVFFEVPNALFTLRGAGVWDVIYEHRSYFGPRSLARVFSRSGFIVRDVYPAFEDQFLCLHAAVSGIPDAPEEREFEIEALDTSLDSLAELIPAFSAELLQRTRGWSEKLAKLLDNHRRIAVWGAGSKGVMFLNTVADAQAIPIVVDINPRKQGKYVAGTGQQIIAPAQLPDHAVDTVLVMNPTYESEIRSMLLGLSITADLYIV